jgi:hypothetical protein
MRESDGQPFGDVAAMLKCAVQRHPNDPARAAAISWMPARTLDMFRKLDCRHCLVDTLARLGDTHDAVGDHGAGWQEGLAIFEEVEHPEAAALKAKFEGLA